MLSKTTDSKALHGYSISDTCSENHWKLTSNSVRFRERDTMTKTDLIESVRERLGIYTKRESADIVNATLDVMKEALKASEKVKITGFGSFTVRSKKKRLGRNPKTGQLVEISPRKVCTFKPSQMLKKSMNS